VSRFTKIVIVVLVVLGLGTAGGAYLYVHMNTARLPPLKPGGREILESRGNEGRMQQAQRALNRARAATGPDRIDLLKRVIQEFPETGEASAARVDLAKALAEQGDTAGALRELAVVIDNKKEGRRVAAALLIRAEITAATDEPSARADLERVKREFAQTRDIQAKAALAYGLLELKRGNVEAAIEILAPIAKMPVVEAAEAAKIIREASLAKSQKLADQGDWKGVVDWSEQMARRFPELGTVLHTMRFREAVGCRMLGRFAEARNLLERLVRDVPKAVLDPTADPAEELTALAQAEDAAGGCRTRAAFLKAQGEKKESRAAFEGDIAADTTWGKDKSPLVLTGLVTVKAGARLTIEAGTVVQFLLGARLAVEGALTAVGTADQPVRFTSAAGAAASLFDGDGIEVAGSSPADACRLEQCVIEFQRVGLTVRKASPRVVSCKFTRNGRDAIFATDEAEPQIEACTIEANDGTGVRTDKASPAVRRSRVSQNGLDGISFLGKSSPVVESSRILGNGGEGISCDNFASAAIKGCEIAKNQGNGVYCNRYAAATIEANVIRENAKNGIRCDRDSSCTIAGNLIEGNVAGGILLDQSGGMLKGNTITRSPKGYGIHCADNASPLIEENWIADNYGRGILCGGSSAPTIRRNAIVGHRFPIATLGTSDIEAGGNYLGEVSEPEAASKFFAQAEEKSSGKVLWRPLLRQAPPRPAVPSPPAAP